MKAIGIGLLGFGTVGAGVVEGLQQNGDILAQRIGANPVLKRIADIDIESDRGVKIDASLLTTDADSVINDPDIDIIIELIGGTGIAKEFVEKALKQKKHVVTANKALLAKHGEELFGMAKENKVSIAFGASVGGGIPIIRALREGLIANDIECIHGILNGTCNYILTRMEKEKLPFEQALKEAQEKGYAEADPSLDIDGFDTAHKAVILASLAYGFMVPHEEVSVEGIRNLSDIDIQYALDLGYRIKLLAVIKQANKEIEVRVHPTLVPTDHLLASVSGVYNAVMVRGNMVGESLLYGKGAGRLPTASTVISDIADLSRNILAGEFRDSPISSDPEAKISIKQEPELETRYYLRLSVLDKPNVLAHITSILGEKNISIASVVQKEGKSDENVPVILLTHEAKGKDLDFALEKISALDEVGPEIVRLRIEE